MRNRLPLILIALTFLLAVSAAGCGSNSSTADNTPPAAGAKPSFGDDSGDSKGSSAKTTSNGAASESAKKNYDACIKGAESISDNAMSANAKQRCEDSYKNMQDASAQIDKATGDARRMCKEAADKIANAGARTRTLQACEQFK